MEDIWAVEEKQDIVEAIDRLTDAVKNQTMTLQIIMRRKDKHSPSSE